ncbi:hypothetical protein O8C76_06445 [Aliarcobacter butzleri]|uniref:Cthe-2314-like HEPN domain-containing protein n=1 Tax=Aliarcobacter butzleri TaxID=28197 RepID=A0AAW7PYF9_9BACT|nr:hypothetical protein [Aliarcobacter butzleri]MDN5070668.1 hypothetical protein [Aliarcobacter butzleri]
MNDINWSLLPTDFKEKYESLVSCEHELITLEILKKFDTLPIKTNEYCTKSYLIFAKEYNSILITAHFFENLLMLEDIRQEKNGHNWFQIEIPIDYFRYPAFNNPKDEFLKKPITKEEKTLLTEVIETTKQNMHYRNDENIIKENLHKLEFISVYSFFEAYLENILIEKLKFTEQDASKKTKYNSLDKLLKIVIDELNPEIEKLLKLIKKDIFEFIEFCYLVRNLHTHKLGVADKKFMKQCFEKGLIENAYGIRVESGEKVPRGYIHTTIGLNNKIIEENKYITISVLSVYFRNFTREIIYIIDSSFNKIDNTNKLNKNYF